VLKFTKKREGINTFVCADSPYVAETPKASIKDPESNLSMIPFGVVACDFVSQPISKQLYKMGALGKHLQRKFKKRINSNGKCLRKWLTSLES